MNIPQMQQRWTGYSSEGSGSLLGAVLGARQASVSERQAGVAERGQKLKEDYFADEIALRKAKARLKKGQSVQKINKLISDEEEVDRGKLKKKWVKNKTGFLHHPWKYIWDREGLIADHEEEFDEIAPRQTFTPDISQILGDNENVSIDPSEVSQYLNTESIQSRNLLDLLMLNSLAK